MSRNWIIAVVLGVLTLMVYREVGQHEFVVYDDDVYVTENPAVQTGLTRQGVVWAFTTNHASNWHPLTWLSHMMDCQFFGLNPGAHHMVNVWIHIANTLLLFVVLNRMTKAAWQSAFVAGLFALHPLHVESVAWVAERKDVLSTMFWLLTMWAYAHYVEQPRVQRYALVLLFFALGLMAKPMLVTLPFVLLLMDFWPLGRTCWWRANGNFESRTSIGRLVWEKLPLFVLVIAASAVTFWAQHSGGAVATFVQLPLKHRVTNALIAYVEYLRKMVLPVDLAVFYPRADTVAVWEAITIGFFLVMVTALCIRAARRQPYLAAGWLWYVGTLVPVNGLVQVGSHSIADRYTYIPLIGIFMIVAWGIPDLMGKWSNRRTALALGAAGVLVACACLTWIQVGTWRNSTTLFEQALKVTSKNHVAHNNLGLALAAQGRLRDAIAQYEQALAIMPDMADAHGNLGVALAKLGQLDEAIVHFTKHLELQPNNAEAEYNLGLAFARQGKIQTALTHLSRATTLNPRHARAQYNLGLALAQLNRLDEAIVRYREALRLRPDVPEIYTNLAEALARQDKAEEALEVIRTALRLDPNNLAAREGLQQLQERPKKAAQ